VQHPPTRPCARLVKPLADIGPQSLLGRSRLRVLGGVIRVGLDINRSPMD
jgi:hypothetical protein